MNERRAARSTLIAKGVADVDAALEHLSALESSDAALAQGLSEHLAGLADPDEAIAVLSRVVGRATAEERAILRLHWPALIEITGFSPVLGEWCAKHPQALARIAAGEAGRSESLSAGFRDRLCAAVQGFGPEEDLARRAALRVAYRCELAAIARWDASLTHPERRVDKVARALAALADAALSAALLAAREEVTMSPGQPGVGRFPAHEVALTRLGIVTMGKCGARELNVVSDVDVLFIAETADEAALSGARAVEIATRLATVTMSVLGAPGMEPPLWEVDANLRPEGRQGALVRTLDGYRRYYEQWAKNWEFQALLKARPAAGDTDLAESLVAITEPLVWQSAARDDFVRQVRAMRERVSEHIPADDREVQLKLGPGGLRDIEFTVQLLQLVHGQVDPSLRVRGTLEALRALADAGIMSRDDAAEFDEAYRFLRVLEHRLQWRRLRRTHLMPRDSADLRVLARAAGLGTSEHLLDRWRRTKIRVRGLHEKVFYRPILENVAALSPEAKQLFDDRSTARLRAVGFRDPARALEHLRALTAGVSRRAAIMKTLLPVMIGWFAEGSDPDAALLSLRKLSEQLGGESWFLRTLRDAPHAAERLTRILSDAKFVRVFLELYPEAVQWLDGDERLVPRARDDIAAELTRSLARYDDDEESIRRILRTVRRREVLRLAIASCLNIATVEAVGTGLTSLAEALLDASLAACRRLDGVPEDEVPFAIIGMGRFGGGELGFGSDLDVLYVTEGSATDSVPRAQQLVHRMTSLLADPRLPLDLDAGLRPEGKSGPLVRTLSAYRAYYEKWSLGWEAQALLRARFVAGSCALGTAFTELANEVRYPVALSGADITNIRHLKARMESERLPQGADPARHLKLGPGSLSDVEWLVQLIQLQHAHDHPELRTESTMRALDAAIDAGLLPARDGVMLGEAWRLASRLRSAVYLESNRQSDSLPAEADRLERVAQLLGPTGATAETTLDEAYLGATRRARKVFEARFYGTV